MDALLAFLVFVVGLLQANSYSFYIGVFAFVMLSGGIHKIPEGHVGVYWRGGAQLRGWTTPGFNFMMPTITSYHPI
jgi:regulator of protease activity HflC (stomatin/prohibitin superfamily)